MEHGASKRDQCLTNWSRIRLKPGTNSFDCDADDHIIMGLTNIARTTRRLPLNRHTIASWIEGRCRCGDRFQVLFRKCGRARDNRTLLLRGRLRANAD